MYALVDCNNFYVACEKVFNPGLEGQPTVVLSNNDGCIISRSDEAKKIGLEMGEPIFKRKQLVEDYKINILSSNYTLYGDMSQRVMDCLKTFSSETEVYSIDECFLNLEHIADNDLFEYGQKIRKTITKNTGIPVCVGIGTTKSLAKIANKTAKKNISHQGVTVLNSERSIRTALLNTPIGNVWGIGNQNTKLLKRNNIKNAYELTLVNDQWIKKNLTIMGLRIKMELLGTSCIPLELISKNKKAIATTRAFGKKTNSLELLKEAVSTYATRCGEKLRKQNCVANLVTVFIHTDPFNKNENYINLQKTTSISPPTNNQLELVKHALMILKDLYDGNHIYKKAGVIVEGLEPASSIQLDLFKKTDYSKQQNLSKVTDIINNKFGQDTLKLSVQGDGKKWKLKQEKLTRKYTTRLSEIIQIKAKDKKP